jgi:hypothetical protein
VSAATLNAHIGLEYLFNPYICYSYMKCDCSKPNKNYDFINRAIRLLTIIGLAVFGVFRAGCIVQFIVCKTL